MLRYATICTACLVCFVAPAAYGQDNALAAVTNPAVAASNPAAAVTNPAAAVTNPAVAASNPAAAVTNPAAAASNASDAVPKRILGIIPNYRTSPSLVNYQPLTAEGKFQIAEQDSFDRGTFVMAAAFAGQADLTKAAPSYGTGMAGYSRYLGAAYGNLVIGDFMTEAIFPTLLHQDPRYFRRGTGSVWSRLRYSVGQIFWTHTDRGGSQFNFSEVLGNATAVAISDAYSPGSRTAAKNGSELAIQLAVDTGGNLLKEFWPDLSRKFRRKNHEAQSTPGN
ncbi:MAG: hypothetical protein ACLQU1_15600 [Bryobacteraceae bacterium]